MRDLSKLPVTKAQLDELARVMAPLSLEHALGLLTAVVSFRTMLPTHVWLPQLLRGSALADIQHIQGAAGTVMALNNFVAEALMNDDATVVCPDPSDEVACTEFIEMYLETCEEAGFDPDNEDDDMVACMEDLLVYARMPDDELQQELGEEETAAQYKRGILEDLPILIGALHAGWLEQRLPPEPIRRAGPKVGRNDPCPCGSGKKHKKCCGASA